MDLKIPELVVDSCCRMNKRPFADPTPIPRLTYTVHRPHITQQPPFVSTQLFAMMSVVSSEGIYHQHTLFPSTTNTITTAFLLFPLPPPPPPPIHFFCLLSDITDTFLLFSSTTTNITFLLFSHHYHISIIFHPPAPPQVTKTL